MPIHQTAPRVAKVAAAAVFRLAESNPQTTRRMVEVDRRLFVDFDFDASVDELLRYFAHCRSRTLLYWPKIFILPSMHCGAKRSIEIVSYLHVVRLSVTLVDQDHIGWKSWILIARTISPTPSLFVAQRPSTCSQGNMGTFWGKVACWEPGTQKRHYLWNA